MKRKVIVVILGVCMLLNGMVHAEEDTLLEDRMPAAWLTVHSYWQRYRAEGGFSEKPDYVIGDADMNGQVEAADALFALYYCVGADPYTSNLPRKMAPHHHGVERYILSYFKVAQGQNIDASDKLAAMENLGSTARYFNSGLITDVNKDGELTVVDALDILKYVVGKTDEFIRKDTEAVGKYQFFVPWIDEWEPGMIYKLGDYHYRDLVWPPADEIMP